MKDPPDPCYTPTTSGIELRFRLATVEYRGSPTNRTRSSRQSSRGRVTSEGRDRPHCGTERRVAADCRRRRGLEGKSISDNSKRRGLPGGVDRAQPPILQEG